MWGVSNSHHASLEESIRQQTFILEESREEQEVNHCAGVWVKVSTLCSSERQGGARHHHLCFPFLKLKKFTAIQAFVSSRHAKGGTHLSSSVVHIFACHQHKNEIRIHAFREWKPEKVKSRGLKLSPVGPQRGVGLTSAKRDWYHFTAVPQMPTTCYKQAPKTSWSTVSPARPEPHSPQSPEPGGHH